MKFSFQFLLMMLLNVAFIKAQPGMVYSYQKISDTQGNFTGILDNDDEFGVPANIGDINGDGITDIAVGSRYDDDGGTDRGAVYIMFMNSNGTVNSYQKISSTQGNFCDPLADYSYFGWSVTGIGDLNSDGIPDIAVSSFNVSLVWVLFLNANGTVQSCQKIGNGLGGMPAGVISGGDFFGVSVRSIGDFNNDGKQEIAVGAERTDNLGAFYIFNLTSAGMVQSYYMISTTTGNFTATLTPDCRFGRVVTPLGDMNNDGVIDLGVSAIYDNDGGTHRGAFYILYMNQNYTVNSWHKISDTQGNFTGQLDDYDQFGLGLCGIGDINGDGIADIAAGANGDGDGGPARGAVWILFMNSNGTVNSYQKISNTSGNFTAVLDDGDRFGGIISNLGDLNNDGHPEIVVGAPYDDDGGYNHGAVYILSLNSECILNMDLGNDQTICQGQNVTLNATQLGGNYLWSNGQTNSSIQVATSGTYSVTVTNSCATASDSVHVEVNSIPVINLDSTFNLCTGQTVILDPGTCVCSYLWSDGSTTGSISVSTAGTYDVTVTNLCGSVYGQTQVITSDNPLIHMGSSGSTCAGDTLVYSTSGTDQYLWSTGSTSSSLSVTQTGVYGLTVTNSNGCSTSTVVTAYFYPLPIITLGNDTSLYLNQSLVLNAGTGYPHYMWNNGTNNQTLSINSGILQNGLNNFCVTVTDNHTCHSSDCINIIYYPFNLTDQQNINISIGWSIISTYIQPTNPSIVSVFSVITGLVIVKNGSGQIYWPQYGVNNIGNLIVTQGYQVKMLQQQVLQVVGNAIVPQNTPISLPTGWNIIAYLRHSPGLISSMLGGIAVSIHIVKNGAGQIYWPYYGLNTIMNMNPGEGYQINTTVPEILTYPPN
ncbi:MAG: FG-GAP-like repeat-containing protein [Bacteroidia bacterium]|nr:FG-GAP-like repeat-containing protein [Bacteroidia bacterium]